MTSRTKRAFEGFDVDYKTMVAAYRAAAKEAGPQGSLKGRCDDRVMAASQGTARSLRHAGYGERIQTGTGRHSYNVWFPRCVVSLAEDLLRDGFHQADG